MTSILALAALGSWTYAGFLAEPTPAPPTPPPASAPIRPIDVESKTAPSSKPEPSHEAPPVQAATTPTRYRLADAGGQVWEHADPAYLRSFVETRNRSSVRQPYFQLLRAPSSRCAYGRCD